MQIVFFNSYEDSIHKSKSSINEKPYYGDNGYDRYEDGYDQDRYHDDGGFNDRYDNKNYDSRYDAGGYDDRYDDRPYDDRYDDRGYNRYDDDRYDRDDYRYDDKPRNYSDRDYPEDGRAYEQYEKRGYERTPSYEKKRFSDDIGEDYRREPSKFDEDGYPIDVDTRPRQPPSGGANGSGHEFGSSSFV